MEIDPVEFPFPYKRETEAISHYLEDQSYFMVTKNLYASPNSIKIRNLALSVIATQWQGVGMDAFVPYLAMNYFDRFVSRNPNSHADVRLVSFCCLTLAAKMRTKSFFIDDFRTGKFVYYDLETITRMELSILNGLEWRMRPVTPFCFLDDYYYPKFKRIGGFKRRSINKIIVRAQEESRFLEYTPSDIAMSSLVAATVHAYPVTFLKIIQPEDVTDCGRKMIDFVSEKHMKVKSANGSILSEAGSSSSATVTKPIPIPRGGGGGRREVAADENEFETDADKLKRLDKGKGVMVAETEEEMKVVASEIEEEEKKKVAAPISEIVPASEAAPISEIVPASEAAPKKLMNFKLKWPTDDPFFKPRDDSIITGIPPPVPIRCLHLPLEIPVIHDVREERDQKCFVFPSCGSRCNIG